MKNTRGFLLIELMIVVSALTIFGFFVMEYLINLKSNLVNIKDKNFLELHLNNAIENIKTGQNYLMKDRSCSYSVTMEVETSMIHMCCRNNEICLERYF